MNRKKKLVRLVDTPLVSPAERYERVARSEYGRLLEVKLASGVSGGLEEVKLRLFLSLLDSPTSLDRSNGSERPTKRVANA